MLEPYRVTPYRNSWRVSGTHAGKRLRKNFADQAEAIVFCEARNAEALGSTAPADWRKTRLSEQQAAQAEAAFAMIGSADLLKIVSAGLAAVAQSARIGPLEPLFNEWLTVVRPQVSARWYYTLKHRVWKYVKAHRGATTQMMTRVALREWLDRTGGSVQTKRNLRNALHRFCGWLCERDYFERGENPAAGITFSRPQSGAEMQDRPLPSVFTPAQAEALLRACELGACRPLLGWMSVCLFTGLRPESEAPRLTWAEVNLRTRELSMMGRKRGAKPRIVPLSDAALAWLRVVKADAMEQPAYYSRAMRRRAVGLANEWLATHHPREKPIVWDEDITRHTFASHRAGQVSVAELAGEMGTSPAMIYGHYRHPRTAAQVKAFWLIRPRLR
jgi:integrase